MGTFFETQCTMLGKNCVITIDGSRMNSWISILTVTVCRVCSIGEVSRSRSVHNARVHNAVMVTCDIKFFQRSITAAHEYFPTCP